MKINNPIPQPLPKECVKAARIFRSFVKTGNSGLDGVIPRNILQNAKGFAIFTVFKAGFVFSARAGSGIVVAKLPDGTWSAPSAIGTAGLGFGGQAGAEMTDFLIVLNSQAAIRTFMSAGSLTLGGNLSIAVGPLGRNGEAMGSMNTNGKVSAMYSYSKTKGLFGGVSVEGSVIVERQDANALAYNSTVTVKSLLSGSVSQPDWAAQLYQALQESIMPRGNNQTWINDSPNPNSGYAFESVQSTPPDSERQSTRLTRNKTGNTPSFPPPSWGQPTESGSYFDSGSDIRSNSLSSSLGRNTRPRQSWEDLSRQHTKSATANFETHFDSDFHEDPSPTRTNRRQFSSSTAPPDPFSPPPYSESYSGTNHARGPSTAYSASNSPYLKNSYTNSPTSPFGDEFDDAEISYTGSGHSASAKKPSLNQQTSSNQGVGRAIALFDFNAVESGDLSFSKGQVIVLIEKSQNTDTWWKGELEGRVGIFPANFVELV